MTASATPLHPRTAVIAPLPWWRRGPKEGWIAVGLLTAMLFVVGRAIDEAAWAGFASGGGQQTLFLPWAAAISGLVGLAIAKSPLPTFLAHLVGAIVGGLYLLVSIANAISDEPVLLDRLRELNGSVVTFYNDSIVLGIRSAETSIFLLTIGTVVWAVGQFGAFNLFRRGHVMPAVIAGGLALLINVTITVKIQYVYLIIFSALAMLLLIRMNLFAQREGWKRRRIGDTAGATALFAKGGIVFVGLTLAGAVFLAGSASSAPLANTWRNMDDQLLSIGTEINRWIGGVTGAARGPSGLFGTSQTVSGVWESDTAVVFRTTSPDGEGYYWRGATYDRFDGFTWQQTDRTRVDIAAGEELLSASADDPTIDDATALPGTRQIQATITSVDLAGGTLLAPATPLRLDRDAEVLTSGEFGPLVTIGLRDAIDPGESYTVSALVPETDPDEGALTAAQLAAASTTYPAWARKYVEIRPESIDQLVYDTADGIVAGLDVRNRDPYHIAMAIQEFLYTGGGFTYTTDVRGLCGRDKVVDCFLKIKRGYCEYFATAMVMLLRTQTIPARLAVGFLPGHQLRDGSYEVDKSAAHAWVELYFPTYGWVRFDPTPGNAENGQTLTTFTRGDPEPSSRPTGPAATPGFVDPDIDEGLLQPGAGRDPNALPTKTDVNSGPVGLIAVFGVIVIGLAIVFIARRRRRFSYAEPDLAYRGMARLATRFGYGPQPTQTAYEYAGALGEVLPQVRAELQLVARARVETVYARRKPSREMLQQLSDAYRRVRIRLLRLFFRRPRRRRKGVTPQVIR
ncbi:MAG: transglutaminaseTgpA domain-containing protein [Candidatus Limnocylindrales bacterium]